MANHVLIVDDDEAVLTMLYKVIKSNGIEADTASCGQDALDLVAQKKYDLILLDVNMHGMDGFEVIQKLRGQNINIPIISASQQQSAPVSNLQRLSLVFCENVFITAHSFLLNTKTHLSFSPRVQVLHPTFQTRFSEYI